MSASVGGIAAVLPLAITTARRAMSWPLLTTGIGKDVRPKRNRPSDDGIGISPNAFDHAVRISTIDPHGQTPSLA